MKEPQDIQAALAQPFAAEDLEWRLQTTFDDNKKGIAVPYVTNRAIMNRLDSVVGVDHWYNDYKPWHGTGKKEAQICGISIFFEDRGWITKWDGAEDSDIEPVKGGLSDSMKRAAVQWGIGRTLYGMDTVYVSVEKKGRSYVIKKDERSKLDSEYRKLLQKLNLEPAPAGGVQSVLIPKNTANQTQSPAIPRDQAPDSSAPQSPTQGKASPAIEFTVTGAKTQKGMSGISTSLALVDPSGKKALGFVRGEHPELKNGAKLFNVRKELRTQDSVVFYLLDSFEIAESDAA
jgi:hypothetical protein